MRASLVSKIIASLPINEDIPQFVGMERKVLESGNAPEKIVSSNQAYREQTKKEDTSMTLNKLLYSVDEVLASNGGILPLSKSAVYKLIREKEIPSTRIGKRVFIPGSFIKNLVQRGNATASA